MQSPASIHSVVFLTAGAQKRGAPPIRYASVFLPERLSRMGVLLRCQFNGSPEYCQIPVLLPESFCCPFGSAKRSLPESSSKNSVVMADENHGLSIPSFSREVNAAFFIDMPQLICGLCAISPPKKRLFFLCCSTTLPDAEASRVPGKDTPQIKKRHGTPCRFLTIATALKIRPLSEPGFPAPSPF